MGVGLGGGIGIRVRLKIEWRNPYEFKSHPGHQIGVLWRSGYAAVCKTAYTGSIPVGTSIFML